VSAGVVVWFTGRPASGKSTLAEKLRASLAAQCQPVCLLDGDALRGLLDPAPGYDEEGRDRFYATLARLAAHLATQGLIVLVPATANRRLFRDRARSLAPRFLEVYVDVPLEECVARDPKGLYRASRGGGAATLPGVGTVYEPPERPDVVARGGHDDAALAVLVARLRAAPRA
jgi:adenylylsulfate kinase